MKTTEGNKLISALMNDTTIEKDVFLSRRVEDLKYHTNWEWLMPVVEKIDSILADDDFVTITYNRCLIEVHNPGTIRPGKDVASVTIEGMGNSRIEATWNAVCEFIEWYNENQ